MPAPGCLSLPDPSDDLGDLGVRVLVGVMEVNDDGGAVPDGSGVFLDLFLLEDNLAKPSTAKLSEEEDGVLLPLFPEGNLDLSLGGAGRELVVGEEVG